MKTSSNGVLHICKWEGLRLFLYKDVGGKWTIGYGHLVKEDEKEKFKAGIKVGEAVDLLLTDLSTTEEGINRLVKVPLTQNQFDALVSFAYNVGLDEDSDYIPEGLGDSTLLKRLNGGDYEGAAEEFEKWKNVNGKPVRGLLHRRLAEKAMFLGTGKLGG